jgi:uncharacterized lipoprotein NlpE involved in copper resistance
MKSTATAILAALALVLTLAGCAGDQSKGPTYPVVGTVDQTKLEQSAFAARSAYAGVLRLMAEYVALPRCGTAGATAICSSQPVVNDMRRYELAADTATSGAVAIARSPTKSPLALANAVADAQRAVEVFRNTVAAVNPKAATAK